MKTEVKMCKCSQCRANTGERQQNRKWFNKAFRRKSKSFLKDGGRDPLDNLTVCQYTD